MKNSTSLEFLLKSMSIIVLFLDNKRTTISAISSAMHKKNSTIVA